MEMLLFALLLTVGIQCLSAGLIICTDTYGAHLVAVRDSELYLRGTEDEVSKLWHDFTDGPVPRDMLVLYERREKEVKRPWQSWALIEYAEQLKTALSQGEMK